MNKKPPNSVRKLRKKTEKSFNKVVNRKFINKKPLNPVDY